jgi:uncharacterized protein (DUF433 family)
MNVHHLLRNYPDPENGDILQALKCAAANLADEISDASAA